MKLEELLEHKNNITSIFIKELEEIEKKEKALKDKKKVKKSKINNFDKKILISITDKLYKKLENEANNNNLNVSSFVRFILTKYLGENK